MTTLVCPALAGVRALVVDDDEDGRDLIAAVFEKNQALVTTASTAAEALGAFARERPRVVVSDIGLPGEDGISLIRTLRAFTSTHGEVFIAVALSGYGSDVEGARSREAGFDAHLTKPVALDLLLQTLTDLLARPS